MSASPQIQPTNVLDNLEGRAESGSIAAGEQILLTPYLTLACALLYMMASDGHLGEQESSHLQGVLGGDDKVLTYALHYVQSVPLEKFLVDAPEVLSTKDKWCILTNVSDALLSDGDADDAELALLAQLIAAFGVTEKAFRTSLTILKLKNDKTILGPYKGVKEDRQAMTPHFALAASLLYMLTADGSIGAEEIGQLEAVIGEFEGLQNVALKYVRSVKLKPFLDEAKATLKREQKLYILTNVCDSMLADGAVARLEDKVFMAMVNAFGFDEKSFAPYYQVFETKNFKPFECSFKNRAVFQHASGAEVEKVELSPADLAANQGVWASLRVGDADMGTSISQTMQENIQSVEQSFGDQGNVELVALNATDAFNLQKIEAEALTASRAKIDGDADEALNRQKLAQDQNSANRQLLDLEASALNRQALSDDALAPHFEPLDTEARVQNIHEVVGVVNERLDHFERQHFSFLQVGRAVRYDDSFALIEDAKSEVNRQRLNDRDQKRSEVLFGEDPNTGGASSGLAENHKMMQIQISVNPNQTNVLSSLPGSGASSSVSRSSRWGFDTRTRQPQDIGIQKVTGFHITRLHYLQLVTAFATLMFAAPISTKTSLSRSAVGPLLFLSQDQAADVRDLN
jgi:uncharacterized tellurite resistance protein B-like protein